MNKVQESTIFGDVATFKFTCGSLMPRGLACMRIFSRCVGSMYSSATGSFHPGWIIWIGFKNWHYLITLPRSKSTCGSLIPMPMPNGCVCVCVCSDCCLHQLLQVEDVNIDRSRQARTPGDINDEAQLRPSYEQPGREVVHLLMLELSLAGHSNACLFFAYILYIYHEAKSNNVIVSTQPSSACYR